MSGTICGDCQRGFPEDYSFCPYDGCELMTAAEWEELEQELFEDHLTDIAMRNQQMDRVEAAA